MKSYCLAVAVAALALPACAAEYFVERSGHDDNPGTRMQPFKTIQKAALQMVPGDVCTVGRGLYRETVRPARSGKPGAPIVFQAQAGESVSIGGCDESGRWERSAAGLYYVKAEGVIQVLVDDVPAKKRPVIPPEWQGEDPAWFQDGVARRIYIGLPRGGSPDGHRIELQMRDWGLDAEGLAHIELKGFNLKACAVNFSGSRMCRLNDCHLWWAGARTILTNAVSGVSNGVPVPAAILLGGSDNEIINSSLIGTPGCGVALLPGGRNNCVVNCLLKGGEVPAGLDAVGILVQGIAPLIRKVSVADFSGGALVCSNVLNARIEYNDLHHSGQGLTNTALVQLTGDGKGTVLAYNWIHDNAAIDGVGIRMEGPSENYVLRQNVVWGQPAAAIALASPSRYNFLFNNTCTMCGAGMDAVPGGPVRDFQETRVINNILVGGVWPSNGGVPPEKLVWKNNYTGMSPGFIDETNRNFALAEGSPCIDAGQEEPEFTDEFTGKLPDTGAYESGKEPFTPGCRVNVSANQVVAPVVALVMRTETEGSEIRYTLDGRTPDATSPVYTGAVPVAYGARIRLKAFRAGMEESDSAVIQVKRAE
jgi:hypothetical protein